MLRLRSRRAVKRQFNTHASTRGDFGNRALISHAIRIEASATRYGERSVLAIAYGVPVLRHTAGETPSVASLRPEVTTNCLLKLKGKHAMKTSETTLKVSTRKVDITCFDSIFLTATPEEVARFFLNLAAIPTPLREEIFLTSCLEKKLTLPYYPLS